MEIYKEKLQEMLLKLMTEIVSVKTLTIAGLFVLFLVGKLSSQEFIVAVSVLLGIRQVDKTLLKLKKEGNDVSIIKHNKEKQKTCK